MRRVILFSLLSLSSVSSAVKLWNPFFEYKAVTEEHLAQLWGRKNLNYEKYYFSAFQKSPFGTVPDMTALTPPLLDEHASQVIEELKSLKIDQSKKDTLLNELLNVILDKMKLYFEGSFSKENALSYFHSVLTMKKVLNASSKSWLGSKIKELTSEVVLAEKFNGKIPSPQIDPISYQYKNSLLYKCTYRGKNLFFVHDFDHLESLFLSLYALKHYNELKKLEPFQELPASDFFLAVSLVSKADFINNLEISKLTDWSLFLLDCMEDYYRTCNQKEYLYVTKLFCNFWDEKLAPEHKRLIHFKIESTTLFAQDKNKKEFIKELMRESGEGKIHDLFYTKANDLYEQKHTPFKRNTKRIFEKATCTCIKLDDFFKDKMGSKEAATVFETSCFISFCSLAHAFVNAFRKENNKEKNGSADLQGAQNFENKKTYLERLLAQKSLYVGMAFGLISGAHYAYANYSKSH